MIEYGAWQVVREIGAGAYGKVYEIERKDLDVVTKAALKVISIPTSQSETDDIRSEGMDEASITEYYQEIAAEVIREFELLNKLKGFTNIVSYEDHIVRPKDKGFGWDILIRMELLTPLKDYLQTHTLSKDDIIKLGIDMCNALERCQKYNIIHRDIKLENIFLSEQGDFKLGDFGIAKTVEKTISNMSRKGTYSYMAPEIYMGKPYDYRVDIYSLGLVMYRLLNMNRAPFMPPYPQKISYKDQEQAMVRRMSGEALPYPCSDSSQLAEIVLKACSYDAKDRYASPVQMRTDLEALKASAKLPQSDIQPEKSESVKFSQKDSSTESQTENLVSSPVENDYSSRPVWQPSKAAPMPVSGQSVNKKEFVSNYATDAVMKDMKIMAILCYVCASLIFISSISIFINPFSVLASIVLVGLTLGMQLRKSNTCIIIIIVLSVIGNLFALMLTGLISLGWSVTGIISVITLIKINKHYKQFLNSNSGN